MPRRSTTLVARYEPPAEFAMEPIERHRLPNGLTLLVQRDARAPVLAYHTWLRVGSSHEEFGKTGLAHLFEHLMFKGTPAHPPGEFDRLMEEAGGHTNASTWLDWTSYYERLPASRLDLPLELEPDRLANLVLDQANFESEREVVVNERRERIDNDPEGRLYEVLYMGAYYVDHPYGWPTLGWKQDLDNLTLDDCIAFYRRHYVAPNTVVVVVGDVDPRDVVLGVAEAYRGVPAGPAPPPAPWPDPGWSGRSGAYFVGLDVASERGVMAWPAPPATDPLFEACSGLAEALFNADSAEIVQRLVYDEAKASAVGAWVGEFRHPGLFHVEATMNPGYPVTVVFEAAKEALTRVATRGPTELEVEVARAQLEADDAAQLASAGGVARALGSCEVVRGGFERLFESIRRVRQLDASQLARAAKWMLEQGGPYMVLGRPEEQR